MRVLHVISSGGMYGAETVILSLMHSINAMPAHGCALAVFHNPRQPPPALVQAAMTSGLDATQVHLLPCRGQIDRYVAARLRGLAARHGADTVHAHGYKADIYAACAWGRLRPALVSTCHTWYDNDLPLRLYGALDRRMLRRFEAVVAVSGEVRDRLLAAHVAPERIELIRNGVAMEPFVLAGQQRLRRQAQSGPLRIGLVGRLAPEKGIDTLLGAAARLREGHPEISFEIAGEGAERPHLQQLLRELHLETRVSLWGGVADMPAFYAGLDLLVSASRQEGLPMALLEGMASGLPVVATRVGAVPQVVREGVTGLLVEPDAPEALAEAMEQLIGSRTLRGSLGQAGQDRIRSEFSAERMTAEYLAVYEQALTVQAASKVGNQRV